MKQLLIDWLYLIPTGTAVGLLTRTLSWLLFEQGYPHSTPTGSYLITILAIWVFAAVILFLRQPRLQKLAETWGNFDAYSTSIGIGMLETLLFLLTIVPLTYVISEWLWRVI